jgi:transposase
MSEGDLTICTKALSAAIFKMFGYSIEVVKRTKQHLLRVLPRRWIVERTFAWLAWSRRLSKYYELRRISAETIIHIAFAHQLLRRISEFLDRFLEQHHSVSD